MEPMGRTDKTSCLTGSTVFVTGGTGSFGQAFVTECLKHDPYAIRIFSRSEPPQVAMKQKFNNLKLRFLIGDVRERDRLFRAMQGVDIVVHAAALKHVDICEYNPIEAVRTNILGAVNVVDCALDTRVSKVINVSSDKAVHPINLYGATKLSAEKLFTHADVYGKTKFCNIRLGNIWNSQGSVTAKWMSEINTGIITVTESEMSRYWITQENAAQFAIKCLEMMQGGEIFIPKMPRKTMAEIAEILAPQAGLHIIGRRAGEKMHELLFSEDEKVEDCGDYYVIKKETDDNMRVRTEFLR